MTDLAPHPSTHIQAAHTAILRDNAAEAEALGMLHPEQLALIHQQQWFKLLVPWVYSGLEKDLPAHVRLQEAISWADGSTGWVVTLCSGAGWFGGFISAAIAQQVFNTPGLCLAGSGATTGAAEMLEGGGYRLNGSWNYASGAYHATHFTANCIIKKNGEIVKDHKNEPWVLPFVVDKKDVTLLPTWKYIGMIATGSNSFKIENLEVDENRCFHIDASYAEVTCDLYQYPFLQLAEATLAVNLSGMALHFTDLCAGIFEERANKPRFTDANRQELKQVLGDAVVGLQLKRSVFFAAVDASWLAPKNNRRCELMAVSKTSRVLAKYAREIVDLLYPYCGLIAAAPDTEINRVWRDLHTASQHTLLTFAD
jgi:alkylation response protein AidB-like acyl-CoA dehydrogenase